MTSLDLGDDVVFQNSAGERNISIPVPQGLTATTYRATIQTPIDVESGELEVFSENTLLDRVRFEGDRDVFDIEIPLADAKASNGTIQLVLRASLRPRAQQCPDWSKSSLRVRDGEVEFDGRPERPSTLSEFIPPVLHKLEIYLPDEPTAAESQAAATLATKAVLRYGAEALDVDILSETHGRPPSSDDFTRRAVINESDTNGIELTADEVPTVEVNGTAEDLVSQVESISSNLWQLAASDFAVLNGAQSVPMAPKNESTLNNLEVGPLTARGTDRAEVLLGIDETRFGQAVGGMEIELRGSYTPPPADRSGLIVVSGPTGTIDSWPADSSGSIDKTITVPSSALSRFTNISVAIQSSGGGAGCGQDLPGTLDIDGDSMVRISAPTTPTSEGFKSLPQALLPQVNVATASPSLADTRRAISLLTYLQDVSAVPLRPLWTSFDDAANGDLPAVLVSSDQLPTGLELPLELTSGRTLEITGLDAPETLRFDSDVDFASVQVGTRNGHGIVVASSNSGPSELDRTLEWLSSADGSFESLSGNILFTAPDRDPTALSTGAQAGQVEGDDSSSPAAKSLIVIGGIASVVVLVLIGFLAVLLRRRRTQAQDR